MLLSTHFAKPSSSSGNRNPRAPPESVSTSVTQFVLRFWGGAGVGRVVVKSEFLKELRKWLEHEIAALARIVLGVEGVNADKTGKQVMWKRN